MTVVVLGWDGLDYDIAEEFGISDKFGKYNKKIDTFDNPVLEKPHTYEIWPSIITGLTPDEHSIHSEKYTEGAGWSSRWLNMASIISKYTVPENVRWLVGRKIRGAGFTFDMKTNEYYENNNIRTIFDDNKSLAIAIPNYRTEEDDELDVIYDRGAQLTNFLNVDTDQNGNTVHSPKTDINTLDHRLMSEVGQKLGAIKSAINQEYSIVFVWIGYLDTVGHIQPVIEDDLLRKNAYEQAAKWTEFIRKSLDEEDTLLCISDHGLKNGGHTHAAYAGSNKDISDIDTVLDVKEWIVKRTTSSDEKSNDSQTNPEKAKDVKEQLEDLGYI